MKNDYLNEALRSLPRQGASEGFTQSVLQRLDESPPRQERQWVRPLLAAAALATLMIGLFLVYSPAAPANQEQRARLEMLESERERLESELIEIRSLMEETAAREIYLGGNDQFEVVIDVGWSAVQNAAVEGRSSNTMHASYPMVQGAGI